MSIYSPNLSQKYLFYHNDLSLETNPVSYVCVFWITFSYIYV